MPNSAHRLGVWLPPPRCQRVVVFRRAGRWPAGCEGSTAEDIAWVSRTVARNRARPAPCYVIPAAQSIGPERGRSPAMGMSSRTGRSEKSRHQRGRQRAPGRAFLAAALRPTVRADAGPRPRSSKYPQGVSAGGGVVGPSLDVGERRLADHDHGSGMQAPQARRDPQQALPAAPATDLPVRQSRPGSRAWTSLHVGMRK